MGACCSKMSEGFMEDEEEYQDDEDDHTYQGDCGARVRLQGSCKFASMFTQQGRKGINQDAMTIWEDFIGKKDTIFCGVFDGHGPSGHKVASHIRDVLPSKLSSGFKQAKLGVHNDVDFDNNDDDGNGSEDSHEIDGSDHAPFASWKDTFIKAFEEMDKELSLDSTIDSFCSGTTAVTILKQGENLIIANLGDSRAILCTRDNKNQPVPVQLTVDLKPNLPSEAERIKRCKGRVFAMKEEPGVYRLWMPDDDCPGLAMARAFGDFCLKDFGLISIPRVSYKKLSSNDEFVVLATDGVWDVLTNKEVVNIVASARKRSMAARLLVDRAVRAWKCKYPCSKVDDCAVICLYLKTKTMSYAKEDGMNHRKTTCSDSSNTIRNCGSHDTAEPASADDVKEEWTALEGVSRVNTVLKLPRFGSTVNTCQERSMKDEEDLC